MPTKTGKDSNMLKAPTANYRQTSIAYNRDGSNGLTTGTVTDPNTDELLGYLIQTDRYQLTARNGNHQYVGTFSGPGMWESGSRALANQ